MRNNCHGTKSKRIQCKDVSTLEILRFIRKQTDEGHRVTWYNVDASNTVRRVILPVVPDCVLRKKLDNMARKGLLDGCGCGCRGDFKITPKGRERIVALAKIQKTNTESFLQYLYDCSNIDTLANREATQNLIRQLEDSIAKGQLTAIDAVLESVDFHRISVRMGTALIRTPARVKAWLPNWQPALLKFDTVMFMRYPQRYEGIIFGLQEFLPHVRKIPSVALWEKVITVHEQGY